MIIGLFLLLFGGGASLGLWMFPEDFDSRVKEILTDKNRKEEVRSVYSDMEDVKKKHAKNFGKLADSFEDEMKSSAIGEAEINETLNEIFKERNDFNDKMITARMSLVKNLTEEEWVKIYAPSSDNDN